MELFGPYRLEDVLGRGGMGEVFRAYDTRRERIVALKRLRPELAAENGYQERFRRECTYAARLSSPHVVPVHDFGELDGQLFLDMRLVEGTDLRKLIASAGPLDPARAVWLIGHVADALDCAHQAGLIHRDVKPSNVIVAAAKGRDFSYLTDFGIVRTATDTDSSLTATGKMIGTLTYMAPELFTGAAHDKQVDIYALGCLLFEALTGTVPFEGEGAVLMYRHLNDPPPRPSAVRPELGEHFDAVIARAMAKEPAARFPSARTLAEAADQALTSQTPATAKASSDPVPAPAGEETSTLTKETASPPTRVLKAEWTDRPRSIRAKLLTVVATVAAVAVIAAGALLYPSHNLTPGKPTQEIPARPTLVNAMTRISVTIPPGWHEVPNPEHPNAPQMVFPVTCDKFPSRCAIGLARIITTHGWENPQQGSEILENTVEESTGVLSESPISAGAAKIGVDGSDGFRQRYTFKNSSYDILGENATMVTGPPDWTGRPEISAVIVWLHTDEPGALPPTVIDEIIASTRKLKRPVNNAYSNWFNNGGQKHLIAISADMGRAGGAFDSNDLPTAERACEAIQKDVRAAESYPAFPDTAGQTYWSAYLDHLARMTTACIAGIKNNDKDQLETGTTEVNTSNENFKNFTARLKELPG